MLVYLRSILLTGSCSFNEVPGLPVIPSTPGSCSFIEVPGLSVIPSTPPSVSSASQVSGKLYFVCYSGFGFFSILVVIF